MLVVYRESEINYFSLTRMTMPIMYSGILRCRVLLMKFDDVKDINVIYMYTHTHEYHDRIGSVSLNRRTVSHFLYHPVVLINSDCTYETIEILHSQR